MIYTLTSAKDVIARVDNNFDIDYADWITRAPLWIADALNKMELVNGYEEVALPLTIEDYHVQIPKTVVPDIKRILGVSYSDNLLIRLNVLQPVRLPNVSISSYSTETYNIKNGHITTSFEEGDIILYCDQIPVEYDEERMVYFPRIPDDSVIMEALEWYIMYSILKKGHKHPLFSLDSNNPITNPFLMWQQTKKAAMNRGSKLDPDERYNIMKLMTTFIPDLNNRYLQETNDNF